MFSQLAKRSSQNVDSGDCHSKYFRSIIRNSLQNLCVFCRGKVSGERLISHGTYCQFRAREYSMEATSMKTLLFLHCLVCCSGEWISCDQLPKRRDKTESAAFGRHNFFPSASEFRWNMQHLRTRRRYIR